MQRATLSRQDIVRLFSLLNAELEATGTRAELYLVGGAVMCLALNARPATRDVDAWFRPSAAVREAANRVAVKAKVPAAWLNDAVKGYLNARDEFDPFLELSHLQVFVARPEYLLAMKCAAMRLGAEFRDLDDVRFLLRALDLHSVSDAMTVVTRYYAEEQLPAKTRLALEELLA